MYSSQGLAIDYQSKLTSADVYDDSDGASISAQGYTACTYVFLEGLFLLFHVTGILLPALFFYSASSASPFKSSEHIYFWVISVGDFVCSILGFMGIWFSRNLLPLGWKQTAGAKGTIAMFGTGLLLVWRCLVLVSFAPWAGLWLAFDGPQEIKFLMYVFVIVYIILCITLVFVLARAFRQTVTDSLRLQQSFDASAMEERSQLLIRASHGRAQGFHVDGEHSRYHEVEEDVFGVFPLAPAITCYALVIGLACLLGFLWVLFSGRSAGGWAFFAEHPYVNTTFWLELFLYLLGVATAFAGVLGCLVLSGSRVKHLPSTTEMAGTCLLIFLCGSMVRFAMLFAITGMTFLEKNTCGFYVHGLAQLAYYTPWSRGSEYWLHCQAVEYMVLLLALVMCVIDGYLLWCTYKLLHFSQDWEVREIAEENLAPAPSNAAPLMQAQFVQNFVPIKIQTSYLVNGPATSVATLAPSYGAPVQTLTPSSVQTLAPSYRAYGTATL